MDDDLQLLEMIKALKEANIGDVKKLDFYYKVIADLKKPLQPKDRNYVVDLYQELMQNDPSQTQSTNFKFTSENIKDIKIKINNAKEEYKNKAKIKVDESKFKLAGGQFCARCKNKLGFRKNKPDKLWGIQGNLCKTCFDYVQVNITNFPALYKQGQLRKEDKVKGTLSIQNFDNTHRIVYGTKEFPHLEIISANDVKNYQILNYEEYRKTKKIMTLGLKSTVSYPHLLIQYFDKNNREQELILYVKDLSNAYNSVGNLVLSTQAKKNLNMQENSFSEIEE